MEKTVVVGTIGAGYAAGLHGNAYRRVSGIRVRLKTVCDLDTARAASFAERVGYEETSADYRTLLADPEIGVIDIAVPTFLHARIAAEALRAGKHVICEKPLSGYFGEPGEQNAGRSVSGEEMFRRCMDGLEELRAAVSESGRLFMYAENYVYAPAVRRAAEIIRAKKSRLLFMKGEESLKGSSSPLAGKWSATGGGTLIRTGTHPLSGMLWLKEQEAEARGQAIPVREVFCDTGNTTFCLSRTEHRHISAMPEDVEDYGVISLTFADGTKALCIASDTVLGGTKNRIEIYANDAALICNLTPTDLLSTYLPDEEGIEDLTLAEMLPSKLGWNRAFVADEVVRGYAGEMQDFMECAVSGRSPESGFDLAYETTRVLYAAYRSAAEGRRISLG